MKPIGFLLLFFLIHSNCYCSVYDEEDSVTDEYQRFVRHLKKFTGAIAYEVFSLEEKSNVAVSPLLLMYFLGEMSVGSNGKIRDEIATMTGIQEIEMVRKVYPFETEKLQSFSHGTFFIANKLYVSERVNIKAEYREQLRNYFNSSIDNINLQNSLLAEAIINSWVAAISKGRMNSLCKTTDFSSTTDVIAVNALYFKGKWKHSFEKILTYKADFHVDNQNTRVIPMMHQTNIFNYGHNEALGVTAIEMPYAEGNLSMFVLLPDNTGSMHMIEQKLMSFDFIDELVQNMKETLVELSLPKTTVETTMEMSEILRALGIQALFNPGASLSGISDDDLSISLVKHTAEIVIGEQGEQVSSDSPWFNPSEPRAEFNVERPFLFLVAYNDYSGFVPVLAGRVYHP